MRLDGNTRIIAHVGYPTGSFKAPLIYNPYFASLGINAAVVPMGVTAEDGATALPAILRMTNLAGALITMPHKISVVGMLDDVSAAVKVAGSCNAVRKNADGTLSGDMFDGEGFVLGLLNKGQDIRGKRVLIVGAGGVGSAIAAAMAAREPLLIALHDMAEANVAGLSDRLRQHYASVRVERGSHDPTGFDIIVNATPLGMKSDDPLPVDVDRLTSGMFVGEVVMTSEMTPLLQAAQYRGCTIQIGLDMLYEMIPAYLDFFGFPTATAQHLRSLAKP